MSAPRANLHDIEGSARAQERGGKREGREDGGETRRVEGGQEGTGSGETTHRLSTEKPLLPRCILTGVGVLLRRERDERGGEGRDEVDLTVSKTTSTSKDESGRRRVLLGAKGGGA